MSKEQRNFNCIFCGYEIIAKPPDDLHVIFLIKPINKNPIEIPYECDNCHKRNTRYWCKKDNSSFGGSIMDERPRDPFT